MSSQHSQWPTKLHPRHRTKRWSRNHQFYLSPAVRQQRHSPARASNLFGLFPHLASVVKQIVNCISKMHIQNHKDDCMYWYSFSYVTGVGCTCGEGIEMTWAEANQTAGSTKKENRGHRHDSLDISHGYWNWEKMVKMRRLYLTFSLI